MSPPINPRRNDRPSDIDDVLGAIEEMRQVHNEHDRVKLEKLDRLETSVGKLDRHITGGDEPEGGLIVRMDRLEQAQAAQRRWGIAALTGGGAGFVAAAKAFFMSGGTPPAHP